MMQVFANGEFWANDGEVTEPFRRRRRTRFEMRNNDPAGRVRLLVGRGDRQVRPRPLMARASIFARLAPSGDSVRSGTCAGNARPSIATSGLIVDGDVTTAGGAIGGRADEEITSTTGTSTASRSRSRPYCAAAVRLS